MPRPTGTIQRALPTSAPARLVNQQPRSGFKPPSPPPRRAMNATPQVRPANFTVPPARMSLSQAASKIAVNSGDLNPVTTAANNCCCAACTGLQCLDRTRFFSGQLLTDADLNNEQSYLLAKNRLHNRYLHGYGVVCGLQVTCGDCPGWVNISPGYAIDPCGNDIIVCTAQSFNVLAAIQNCCTPPAQTTNCGPVRNMPPPTCQQQIQTWCITIQYQEQQTNMVTPLQPVSSSSGCGCGTTSCVCGGCASGNKMSRSGCGCGGSNSGGSGCGCGCQGSSSGGCSCSSCAASTTSSSAAACQATRILEGFQLGVCQQQATLSYKVSPVPGALTNLNAAEPFATYQLLNNAVKSKPAFLDSNGNPTMSNTQAYQAAGQYLTSAQNIYINAGLQNCQGYDDLYNTVIQQPPPPGDATAAAYPATLQSTVDTIATKLGKRGVELFCAAMMPPCPPVACDTRLILACVTVCNGNIMDVCQFGGGRKLLVGFPTIAYWISLVNPNFGEDIGAAFEILCCDQSPFTGAVFNSDTSPRAFLSGSAGSPAMFNRAVASYASQAIGATLVNAVYPQAATVDLRPYVNLSWAQVQNALSQSVLANDPTANVASNITFTDVSADPTWTDDAIANSVSYAPAAFQVTNPVTQLPNPLTIYYRGGTKVDAAAANKAPATTGATAPNANAIAVVNQIPQDAVVVGFSVTSPTDYLSSQITALKNQIGTLQNQITALQAPPTTPPGAAPTTPTQPTPPPAPPADSVDASAKPGKKK